MRTSPLASPSATRAVLETHGIRLKKSLGQHFLVDDNIVGHIMLLADIDPGAPVLEIGPGIGTLSVALCAVAGAVVAVERDADLLPVLADTMAGCGRFSVVSADAVAVTPEQLTTPLGPPVALVANLPYSVAATVVLKLLQELDSLRSATVMVQAEVADRMTAVPGGKDYGAYTVKLRLLAEPSGRFPVPRGCFMPPPRVDSAVLRLDRVRRDDGPAVVGVAGRMATAAFSHRRKTLRNSVLGSGLLAACELDGLLAETGIDGSRRAETLSVDEYLDLARYASQMGLVP
jgi:16S rRNA (adenine1518-N6/adenine1519-N6)-dimethyltransferase